MNKDMSPPEGILFQVLDGRHMKAIQEAQDLYLNVVRELPNGFGPGFLFLRLTGPMKPINLWRKKFNAIDVVNGERK